MKFFSTLIASTLGTLIAFAVAFLFFIMFVIAMAASSSDVPRVRDGSLLVAEFSGAVPEQVSGDPFAQMIADEPAVDLFGTKNAIRKAAADSRIAGLWIRVGGAAIPWATIEELRTSILAFKESGKPVYASSDDFITTEGEFFLMSAADSIFAPPGGLFEYDGFAIVSTFYKGLLDKLEIEPQIVRAGRFKSAVEPYQRTDMSAENRKQLEELLSVQESVYHEAISTSRAVPVDDLRARASENAILAVEDALDAGLVDALLHSDQVVEIWKRRLGVEEEDDLRTIQMKRYARVPASSAGIREGKDGEIAIVYAVGTIVGGDSDQDSPFGSAAIGSDTFTKAIREARESDKIKAVVLRINSPGGFAPAADAMLRELSLTSEEKPLVVSMGDLAASGGYWIAMAADTIVAEPLTLTGSIGAFSLFFNTGEFFSEKLGVTFDRVRTSPYADMFSGVRSLTDGERKLLEDLTDSTYDHFLSIVAENRGMGVEQVDELGQGRVWMGRQAKEEGLVDVLGDLDRAIEIAAGLAGLEKGSFAIRTLPRPKTFLDRLTRSLDTQAARVWARLTLSDMEREMMAQIETVRRAVADHGTVQARMPYDIRID